MIKDAWNCLQGARPPWQRATARPVPSAGWVRRDKTELLLIRSVASLPRLSPASFLTISSVLTAPPLAEPKLPLPPAAHRHTGSHTHGHTYTHYKYSHSNTPHTGTHVRISAHTPAHRQGTHIRAFTPMCVYTHTYYTHIGTYTHMLILTHINTHTVFSWTFKLQTHFFPERLFFRQISPLKGFYLNSDEMPARHSEGRSRQKWPLLTLSQHLKEKIGDSSALF